jgi:DNA-directed RNA polymerase subunit K/omega
MLEMEDPTQVTEQQPPEGSAAPAEPAPPITSRFLYVDVAALRAKQIRRGARPRYGADGGHMPHKAERLAMEEVRRGLVHYDLPEPRPRRAGEEQP